MIWKWKLLFVSTVKDKKWIFPAPRVCGGEWGGGGRLRVSSSGLCLSAGARGEPRNRSSLYTENWSSYFYTVARWHISYHHVYGSVVVVVVSPSSHSLYFPPLLNVNYPAVQLLDVGVCQFVCVCVLEVWLSTLCPEQVDNCETQVPLPIIQRCLMRSQGHGAGMTLHICRI